MEGLFPPAPLTEREVLQLGPVRLAYVGDAVHELMARTAALSGGGKARAMHRSAVGSVNAAAQARALERVAELLTQTEADVVRRGRNAHGKHGPPRSADPRDYAQATGLEALLGFLYLTGRMERLTALYEAMQSEVNTCPPAP